MKIGIAETVGIGWKKDSQYVQQIQAVTAEQIQQVAKKYFVPQTLTVATLKPIKKQDNETGDKEPQQGQAKKDES